MLFDIYTAIKAQIETADEDGTIKGTEWYNVQYEGSIPTTPRILLNSRRNLLSTR